MTYEHLVRARYVDCDMQGIVYNAHYLTWYDVAITEFLRAIGYDYPLGGDPETGCVNAPTTGNSCDDGSACTTGDVCQAGECGGLHVGCCCVGVAPRLGV